MLKWHLAKITVKKWYKTNIEDNFQLSLIHINFRYWLESYIDFLLTFLQYSGLSESRWKKKKLEPLEI